MVHSIEKIILGIDRSAIIILHNFKWEPLKRETYMVPIPQNILEKRGDFLEKKIKKN